MIGKQTSIFKEGVRTSVLNVSHEIFPIISLCNVLKRLAGEKLGFKLSVSTLKFALYNTPLCLFLQD